MDRGFSPDYLRPIADKLADKYQFILLHQRGTGKSSASISMNRKLVLVGHSFGGIVSMMYAREDSDRTGMLALVGSGGPTGRRS